jgi:hypothetical protein
MTAGALDVLAPTFVYYGKQAVNPLERQRQFLLARLGRRDRSPRRKLRNEVGCKRERQPKKAATARRRSKP